MCAKASTKPRRSDDEDSYFNEINFTIITFGQKQSPVSEACESKSEFVDTPIPKPWRFIYNINIDSGPASSSCTVGNFLPFLFSFLRALCVNFVILFCMCVLSCCFFSLLLSCTNVGQVIRSPVCVCA